MAPELTLDRLTGAINLQGLTRLAPRSRKANAAATLAPFVRREQDSFTGYVWLYTAGFGFGGKPCRLNLCFRDGGLDMASWSVELGTGESGGIDAEVAFMRAALGRQLGRTFRAEEHFDWGWAWCSYDPRSDIVSGGVRYR